MPETITQTPPQAAPKVKRYQPMPWDQLELDPGDAPFEHWLFIIDIPSGKIRQIETVFRRDPDPKKRIAEAAVRPTGWPLSQFLTKESVEKICRTSHAKVIPFTKAFIQLAKKGSLSQEVIDKLNSAPEFYWRPPGPSDPRPASRNARREVLNNDIKFELIDD